jgi:RNA polymerase-binding transcription factor DksA
MNANPSTRATDNLLDRSGSLVWNRLHSEREEICEALVKEPYPDAPAPLQPFAAREEVMRTKWHRELLQARLRKIDDALDRLMSGSYGNCSKCGRWIEDTKLAFDPAVAFCIACWEREQTIH